MKRIGLTGGVGTGKSTAAGFLLARGVRLVDTDELARQLVRPGEPALAEIVATFGRQLLTPTGELDRAALAKVVFSDTGARQRLEGILHPQIRSLWQGRLTQWEREGASLAVVVIPLLYETGAETSFDAVVCTGCLPASQRERLTARGWSAAEVEQRLAAQWPLEKKLALAQAVVWTEGAVEVHQAQVARIWGRFGSGG